jgi:phospholipid/cholesterol/gamma-HCH transport system permease protein
MAVGPAELGTLLGRSVHRALARGIPRGELTRQIYEIGYRSLLLVVGGMIFFGAVMSAHGAYQGRKVVGDLGIVGPAYFEVMIRELGPTIAGILAAVRIGAAVAAEVAAMKVTGQLEALQLSAGDPYSDIAFPRILGGLVAIPALIIAGTAAAALTTVATMTYVYNADGWAFVDPTFVDAGDLLTFFGKAFGYGLAIPLAAVTSGMSAHGGPGAVGAATTTGVVASCMLVLLIDLLVSAGLFWAGL